MRVDLSVVIIGAGPAGLAAAEVLAQAGHRVQVYEQKPSAARKLLMAGKTGLNISHTEDFEQFINRYDQPDWLRPMILPCQSSSIEQWMAGLGIESYVGSSGRLFPVAMKAAPLLRAWLNRLKNLGVTFFYRHQWIGWTGENQLEFVQQEPQQRIVVEYAALVLATGGGSWARLGSDAAWVKLLQQQQVKVLPLQASNVGIRLNWSAFIQPLAGQPLKRVNAWVDNTDLEQSSAAIKRGSAAIKRSTPQVYHGEAVISHYGLEGGLIYRLNRDLRLQLNRHGQAVLYMDLLPDVTPSNLVARLNADSKQSLANRWRKAGLDPVKIALIREFLPKTDWQNSTAVAAIIKKLPLSIQGFQPMDEAISTAGGVDRQAMTEQLMLLQKPGVFCCGEMLDWDAPTGGYLLTACLATGQQAAQGVIDWLRSNTES